VEDIKAYIESGILELYVLGDVSQEERRHVETMVSEHPAIKAELAEIERSMELYAAENAIEPSEDLRGRILNSLLTNFSDDDNFPHKKEAVIKDNIIAFPVPKANNFYRYAFAACLALLILSVAALVDMYNQLNEANTQLVALSSSNQHFTKTVNFMDHQLSIYRDPSFKVIKLQGTAKHANASMLVAFSPIKRQVMIDMAGVDLPLNDSAHQYQLWALVGGKPVSLGVFDKTGSDSVDMKQMQSIAVAQTFAVTLEPKGGSVNPTMDQMMVIGNF
jgi:anti-sigma-K factor RskA